MTYLQTENPTALGASQGAATQARQQPRAAAALATKIVVQDEKVFIGRSQDCTPIAEVCKAAHNARQFGSGEMRHAARIPNVIIEQYCNDNGVLYSEVIGDPVHMRRICNDPKNAMFRIWPGKL